MQHLFLGKSSTRKIVAATTGAARWLRIPPPWQLALLLLVSPGPLWLGVGDRCVLSSWLCCAREYSDLGHWQREKRPALSVCCQTATSPLPPAFAAHLTPQHPRHWAFGHG